MNFTSEDAMACDVFVTKVLQAARIKPKDWPDPNWTTVMEYRSYMKNNLTPTASRGWNIVVMISDNPTIELNGQIYATDPTPHMGLINKKDDGSFTLYHYTKDVVKTAEFSDELDLNRRLPEETYRYDTFEYKSLE